MTLTPNALAWQIRPVESQFFLNKEGMKKTLSYERHDYEAQADAPQFKTI